MVPQLSEKEKKAVVRIAGLTILNAMVFQEMLAEHEFRVNTLRQMKGESDRITAFAEHWQFITENINYYPIFHVAREALLVLSNDPDIIGAIDTLIDKALRIVGWRAALRHDLMGRLFHVLLADAKYLGAFYTSVPAAVMLLKLALDSKRWGIDWADLRAVKDFHICDLSCGTGTLLMASADAVVDNYVGACAAAGNEVKLDSIHKGLLEESIWGFDVVPSALHLTASTLAMRSPATVVNHMNLFSLPMGGVLKRLGSIEFIISNTLRAITDLFGTPDTATRIEGGGVEELAAVMLPALDLCVINPPFTRSVGGNLLFGSLPAGERKDLQKRLAVLMKGKDASTTAGLGSVFVAVADKHINIGGRIALVLPKALLSGVAWGKTRNLFFKKYQLEYLVVSHDPERWNFSENTDLSEVLAVAKKVGGQTSNNVESSTICLNLWRNPSTSFEALSIAQSVTEAQIPDLLSSQGSTDVSIGDAKVGEAVSIPWSDMRKRMWILPCAFAQSDLTRVAYKMTDGELWLPSAGDLGQLNLCTLREVGELGPDRRDIHDGFCDGKNKTNYPAFWGHDASKMVCIDQKPNRYLSPVSRHKAGRPMRRVGDLWPKAGSILLAERLWLNTQRLVAVRMSAKVLSNVWWPLALEHDDIELEKGLSLWLNSTLGLVILLFHREETRGAWVDFRKPVLGEMPILDIRSLSAQQRRALADAFDELSAEELLPFPHMANDPVRERIDAAISAALGLPDIGILREMLAREPVVCLRPLY